MGTTEKDELYAVFRANVRALREERGWSQSELARRMGVRPSFVCDLENGRSRKNKPLGVSLATVADVAKQLGVPPATLLTASRPHP